MVKRINNKEELNTLRKELRNHGTSAEATLWLQLKGKQLASRKFRRQHSVGPYIVDFYCTEERLVIELDGAHHYTEEGYERDQRRTVYLNGLDIRVLRFENAEVFENMPSVLAKIRSVFSY